MAKKTKVVKKEKTPKEKEVKKVEVKEEKEVKKLEVKEEIDENIPVQPRLCEFEDTYVVEKLNGRHTPTAYHCYCEDGSTRHVPRELLDNLTK